MKNKYFGTDGIRGMVNDEKITTASGKEILRKLTSPDKIQILKLKNN